MFFFWFLFFVSELLILDYFRPQENEKDLRELFGPSWWDRWIWWQYCNDAQKLRNAVKNELEKIIYNDPVCKLDYW